LEEDMLSIKDCESVTTAGWTGLGNQRNNC
jgi:hypothetical protein